MLEAAATRRDAKGYLQKYTKDRKSPSHGAQLAMDTTAQQQDHEARSPKELAHAAVIKLRDPQHLEQDTMLGVAKTLVQLRMLGLLSVVVVDCGLVEDRHASQEQALRLCEAIDSFGKPASKLMNNILMGPPWKGDSSQPSITSDTMYVDDGGALARTFQHGLIPVISSLASRDGLSSSQPVDSDRVLLALTSFLSGFQFPEAAQGPALHETPLRGPEKIAAVERVIIIDPLGGTPVIGRPGATHSFVNLEQEFQSLIKHLMGAESAPLGVVGKVDPPPATHAANLRLARDTLDILPPSSSALITTPWAAANTISRPDHPVAPTTTGNYGRFGLDGMVTTRRKQNPLLHNLLTDKPVYSSSLPMKRARDAGDDNSRAEPATAATLVKRGMPLTILPDPAVHPWVRPQPGSPQLRLTDNCVDLPRLVHLIEDSFNRRLDVQDYLDRVNDRLAGIIIAGEYEGGAILTWETPPGLSSQEAYESGRMVPYLDKFAVMKSRQGSGGVADIVFNAMVRDCFPEGVCWRSRKDNPVNKWYFERSAGTNKLSDSPWAMFWTTVGLKAQGSTLLDYAAVCRGVVPSWASNKHIPD